MYSKSTIIYYKSIIKMIENKHPLLLNLTNLILLFKRSHGSGDGYNLHALKLLIIKEWLALEEFPRGPPVSRTETHMKILVRLLHI